MGWNKVLEKEVEGRRVIVEEHSEGGWRATAPATEDKEPDVQVDDTSTMIGLPQIKGKDYTVEAEDLEGLRRELKNYDFSDEAADEIIGALEGF